MTALALRLAQPAIIIRPAIVYAMLFASIGASFPYVAVFLRSIGLTLEVVGLFIGFNALVSVIAAPVWGALADALGDVRRLLLAGGLASAAVASVIGLTSEPLVIGFGMAVWLTLPGLFAIAAVATTVGALVVRWAAGDAEAPVPAGQSTPRRSHLSAGAVSLCA
jgi:MFS family permease